MKAFSTSNTALVIFATFSALEKSFEVMDDPLESLLPDAIHTLTTSNADGGLELQELLVIAGGNVNWYNHFRRQFDNFGQN